MDGRLEVENWEGEGQMSIVLLCLSTPYRAGNFSKTPLMIQMQLFGLSPS
jgi:hypothetical protein